MRSAATSYVTAQSRQPSKTTKRSPRLSRRRHLSSVAPHTLDGGMETRRLYLIATSPAHRRKGRLYPPSRRWAEATSS
jgi:hypothetical protein